MMYWKTSSSSSSSSGQLFQQAKLICQTLQSQGCARHPFDEILWRVGTAGSSLSTISPPCFNILLCFSQLLLSKHLFLAFRFSTFWMFHLTNWPESSLAWKQNKAEDVQKLLLSSPNGKIKCSLSCSQLREHTFIIWCKKKLYVCFLQQLNKTFCVLLTVYWGLTTLIFIVFVGHQLQTISPHDF